MKDNALEILKQVEDKIATGWSRGSMARDDNGASCSAGAKRASCWCLLGAFFAVTRAGWRDLNDMHTGVTRQRAVKSRGPNCTVKLALWALMQAIRQERGARGPRLTAVSVIMNWNDRLARGKTDVRGMLKHARHLLRAA
jgi:hypothetical protein